MGKDGEWKNMTRHQGLKDAKSNLPAGDKYRIQTIKQAGLVKSTGDSGNSAKTTAYQAGKVKNTAAKKPAAAKTTAGKPAAAKPAVKKPAAPKKK
jgi:hypothetical protein